MLLVGFIGWLAQLIGWNNGAAASPLWDRLGGEVVIKPMVSAIYGRHASDPLSADMFGPHKFDNNGIPDVVKNAVFTFFSAGIGTPHEHEGLSMLGAHKKMDIDEPAFWAVSYHVMEQMEKFKAGGKVLNPMSFIFLNSNTRGKLFLLPTLSLV